MYNIAKLGMLNQSGPSENGCNNAGFVGFSLIEGTKSRFLNSEHFPLIALQEKVKNDEKLCNKFHSKGTVLDPIYLSVPIITPGLSSQLYTGVLWI